MASSPPPTLDIAIIGGGIAGLTLTVGLLKQNHIRVTLYESAPRFGEIGAGIGFGPNAVRAMEKLDPAVKAGFLKVVTSNLSPSKQSAWFDFRVVEDGEWRLFHTLNMQGFRGGCRRADFLDELVRLVPDGIARFNKRLVGLEDLGEEGLRLRFRDGSEARHQAVVGCDGIKSVTRQYILGRDDPAVWPRFSKKYCHRGLIPMGKAIELLGEDLAGNNQMYMGRHAHILTFPIAKGKLLNVVAFNSRETWDSEDWVVPSSRSEMYADYDGWGPATHKLLSLVEKPDIWALFEHPPASTYYKGRVCMTGDAAHASTPHQGAGAGMAVEDAYVLSNLLGEAEDSAGAELAFKAYDAVRRERTQKLVATSREAGQLWELELDGVADDLGKVKENVEKRMRWIWEEDLEMEIQEGRRIMAQKAVS